MLLIEKYPRLYCYAHYHGVGHIYQVTCAGGFDENSPQTDHDIGALGYVGKVRKCTTTHEGLV